jgi:TP901 family phage tail tape measure protein
MSTPISKNQIVEEGVLDNLLQPLKIAQDELSKTDAALQKLSESVGKLSNSETAKGIRDLAEAEKELNAVYEMKKKVQRESIDIENKSNEIRKNTEKEAERTRLAEIKLQQDREKAFDRYEQKLAKQAKDEATRNAKAAKDLERQKKLDADKNNAYKQLETNTRLLKEESKKLGAQLLNLEQSGQKNTRAYKDLKTQYDSVTKAAQQGDSQLKKLDKTVGDNFRNVGNYASALNGLKGALSSLGIAFGASALFKNVSGVVMNFDQAVADLAAISGKSSDELAGLNKQAKDLGATTQFTATDITNLQIELAKLGFTTQQITDSTGAIASFAAATGADIPDAAALAGSALRAFGLDATEMDRVVSTLGVATTKTALDFAALQTGLSTVAPVAAAFGFSIEDTTALLGQLANAGFDASSAATATRNILLKMADSGGDLAQALGRPIKTADDLAQALQDLDAKGIDLAQSLELTDARSVAAFQTFLKGSGTLVELRDSITGADEALDKMAKDRMESLGGALALLNSTWEAFILDLNETTGAASGLTTAIKFLADNFQEIIGVIKKVATAWVLYKATIVSLVAIEKLRAFSFRDFGKQLASQIPMTKAYRLEQQKLATQAKASGEAVKGAGNAMKAVPWIAIIAVLIEVAKAFYDIASGAKAAREQAALTEKYTSQAEARATARTTERTTALSNELKILDAKRQKDLAAAKTDEQRAKIEAQFLKDKQSLVKETENQVKTDIRAVNQRRDGYKLDLDRLKLLREEGKFRQLNNEAIEIGFKYGLIPDDFKGNVEDLVSRELKAKISASNKALTEYNKEWQAVKDGVFDVTTELEVNAIAQENNSAKITTKIPKIKELNTQFKTTNDYLSRQAHLLNEIADIEDESRIRERERQLDDLMLSDAVTIEQAKVLVDEINQIKQEALNRNLDFELQRIEDKYASESAKEKELIEQKRMELLAQEGLTKENLLEIENNYQAELDKIAANELKRAEDLALEKELIEKRRVSELVDLEYDLADKLNQINEDILDRQKKTEEDVKKDKESSAMEIAKRIEDFYNRAADNAIASLQRQIDAAANMYNAFAQLAAQGNIQASQSMAEMIERQEQLQRRQEQIERRKLAMQRATGASAILTKAIESGKPLPEALAEMGVFLATTLPSFYEGTENTGKGGKLDSNGGFIAKLHKGERVITENQNRLIGDVSNPVVADVVYKWRTGQLENNAGNSAELMHTLNQKLDSVVKAIQNQPQQIVGLEETLSGMVKLTVNTRKGSHTNSNKFQS